MVTVEVYLLLVPKSDLKSTPVKYLSIYANIAADYEPI